MPYGGDWKDLLRAAGDGDLARAKYLIKQDGVDPNFQHPEYFTCPIFEAIRGNSNNNSSSSGSTSSPKTKLEMVQLLVEQGKAQPDIIEELTDQTPIEVALELGYHDICDYLYKKQCQQQQQRLQDRNHSNADTSSSSSSSSLYQYWPRTVLVTGGTHGIGKAIVELLLRQGHYVIFTCCHSSDSQNATTTAGAEEDVRHELITKTRNSKLEYILGNFNSIPAVIDLSQRIIQNYPTLNVIIHTSEIIWPTQLEWTLSTINDNNDEQLELGFMINYMAPYILTRELRPLLERNGQLRPGQPSRVILVNNTGLPFLQEVRANISQTPFGKDFHPLRTYANTKQCRILYMLHQARTMTLSSSSSSSSSMTNNVTITTVDHSGGIHTGLGESTLSSSSSRGFLSVLVSWILWCIFKLMKPFFWKDPIMEGAIVPVWLAVSPEANGLHGLYFNEFKQVQDIDDIDVNSSLHRTIQDDWAQWTIDFLTRHETKTKNTHTTRNETNGEQERITK